jgi:hypothetical protein
VPTVPVIGSLTDTQRAIIAALSDARTVDEVIRTTGLDAGKVMSDVTLLEIRRVLVRSGRPRTFPQKMRGHDLPCGR